MIISLLGCSSKIISFIAIISLVTVSIALYTIPDVPRPHSFKFLYRKRGLSFDTMSWIVKGLEGSGSGSGLGGLIFGGPARVGPPRGAGDPLPLVALLEPLIAPVDAPRVRPRPRGEPRGEPRAGEFALGAPRRLGTVLFAFLRGGVPLVIFGLPLEGEPRKGEPRICGEPRVVPLALPRGEPLWEPLGERAGEPGLAPLLPPREPREPREPRLPRPRFGKGLAIFPWLENIFCWNLSALKTASGFSSNSFAVMLELFTIASH
mmetsp:Transcript_15220/g.19302  ORF Transcript_15220/g.19302 Transcript_15220/m.19302 type:complete len:263 (-) Transcript_15220:106-894(-)